MQPNTTAENNTQTIQQIIKRYNEKEQLLNLGTLKTNSNWKELKKMAICWPSDNQKLLVNDQGLIRKIKKLCRL